MKCTRFSFVLLPVNNLKIWALIHHMEVGKGLVGVKNRTKLTNSMELSTIERSLVVWTLDSFPAFYGTRKFNTEFTRALHLSLS
jgi:hypothetical protein